MRRLRRKLSSSHSAFFVRFFLGYELSLADDDALSGHLQGQQGEDVLDIILFGEDELGVRLAQIDLSRF